MNEGQVFYFHDAKYSLFLLSRRNFLENFSKILILHSIIFLVFSFSCCLEDAFTSWSLTTTNLATAIISNNKQIEFIQQKLKRKIVK